MKKLIRLALHGLFLLSSYLLVVSLTACEGGSSSSSPASTPTNVPFPPFPGRVAPYVTVTTALSADIDNVVTSIGVTTTAGFPTQDTFIATLAEGTNLETVWVTGGMGTNMWTVTRAYNGTTAHAFTAALTTITYNPLVHLKDSVINNAPSIVNAIVWPPSYTGTDPKTIIENYRFDNTAPVYITQSAMLARYGAILTASLAASGETAISVNQTSQFPSSGDFIVNVGGIEDISVNVANATTLNIVARAQNGTSPTTFNLSPSAYFMVRQADFVGGAGSGSRVDTIGGLNSQNKYVFAAPAIGALAEWGIMYMDFHFIFDGQIFEILSNGNISFMIIADGVIQHPAGYLVESPYSGKYWHKFDFGSRKTRKVSIFASGFPGAIAVGPGDSLIPWNRSQDPVISFDGDSYGQVEEMSWSTAPNTGGMGLYLEMLLALGITQFDMNNFVGATGYDQQSASNPPAEPRPRYSSVNRVAATVNGQAPTIFFCGQGHNDTAGASYTTAVAAYWAAVRAAWPNTILVAAQFYQQGNGATAPQAFLPFAASLAKEAAILAALQAAGGPWIYINSSEGTWQNSSGASGVINTPGVPLITGTGYGQALGYSGVAQPVGNANYYIRNDAVHPSNIGSRYLGTTIADAIRAGMAAL